jgi:hypothetical protein
VRISNEETFSCRHVKIGPSVLTHRIKTKVYTVGSVEISAITDGILL